MLREVFCLALNGVVLMFFLNNTLCSSHMLPPSAPSAHGTYALFKDEQKLIICRKWDTKKYLHFSEFITHACL